VQIRALDSRHRPIGSGTGFFVSANGLLATNLHVIRGASSLQVETLEGDIYDLVYLVTSDARRDIAILKIPVDNARPLPLASDADVAVGANVYVMGNPLGQVGTFSNGLVSAQRSLEGVTLVQITAPVSPGSSGGPVMNEEGEVIGVTTLMLRGGQNLNYAVPVRYVRPLAASNNEPRLYSERPSLDRDNRPMQSASRALERNASGAETARSSRDLIETQFRTVDSVFRIVGLSTVGGVVRGSLNESEVAPHPGTFEPGADYLIVGRCDVDCTDLDLELSSSDGSVVAEDRDADDKPYVRFRARAGSYRLRVIMSSCQLEPCAYGLRVYRSPDAP
jgi:hypothetical protein